MKHPFDDIAEFHTKFGFSQPDRPTFLHDVLLQVRMNFLLEELIETAEAAGFMLTFHLGSADRKDTYSFQRVQEMPQNLEKHFDGLIDLNYVSYGTAWLQRLPLPEGWNRVHAANMEKIRAERAEDSKRGTTFDVIKPKGWTPPKLDDLLT